MSDLSSLSNADLLALKASFSTPEGAINQIESSGAADSTPGIVNRDSGARGSMQVLASTARDPGFGLTPSNGTPQDDARLGRQYYAMLRQRYGDPSLAAVAYQMGPGAADKWIANGGSLADLPDDALKYLGKWQTIVTQGAQQRAVVPGVTDNPMPTAIQQQPSSNPLVATAGGIGEGFGKTMLGGQALVGRGLQAVGANGVGDWLVNDAQNGARNLTQQGYDQLGNSGWRTAGNIGGAVVPMLFAGPELLPQIAAGGAFGASQGALNDTGILPGAVEGAGLGALGYGAGQLLGAGINASRPLAARAWNAMRGGEQSAAGRIAGQLGENLDPTIAALRANSDELIPGSLPTAAEAANNPAIIRLQRAMQNTEAGQVAFPARMAENNAARFAAGRDVVGPNLGQEVDDFTRAQAQRLAAGQAELPPLTAEQAQIMQSPAYIRAMKVAQGSADNAGSDVFAAQQRPLQQALAQGIEDVAGTPATLDALRAARGDVADEMFRTANITLPVTTPKFAALLEKPAFRSAIDAAQKASDNLGEGSIFATTQNRSLANMGGARGVETQLVTGRGLLYAKGVLDDQIGRAMQLGENAKARPLMAVRDDLVSIMDDATGGEYAAARAKFQADSAPIDAQMALQKRLNTAVDPVTGDVSAARLRQTIDSVTGEQLKPGIRQADKVTPDMLDQLRTLSAQARATPTNMTGLSGEGQEYLRAALNDRLRSSADSLINQESRDAAAQFSNYLRTQSPSYADYLSQQATTGADLTSRQALREALDKLGLLANNASGEAQMTYQAAKSALGREPLTGGAEAYKNSLLADLQRASTANVPLGAAGSQTAANMQLGGGLLGRLIESRAGDTGMGAALGTGNFGAAAVGYVVRVAVGKAAERTEKAAIDLLLNPKKLANALEEFKRQPQAKKAFIDTLKEKATGAGRAGMRAVQAYEASRQGNKK